MTIETGQRVVLPALEFTDAEGTPTDIEAALADGPLLLALYKSSCASSKQMFPFLERLHQRHMADGLQVLGVSQDSPNITRSFARRFGITFPIVVEGEEFPLSRALDIMATPTIFLIEASGNVAYTTMGFLKPSLDAMGDAVADSLGVAHSPLISSDDDEVPMFVPG